VKLQVLRGGQVKD